MHHLCMCVPERLVRVICMRTCVVCMDLLCMHTGTQVDSVFQRGRTGPFEWEWNLCRLFDIQSCF